MMSEMLNEEKSLESTEKNCEAEKDTKTIKNDGLNNKNPRNKKNLIIFCAVILVYTIIIVASTIAIDRAIIVNQVKNGFEEAFGEFDDTENNNEANNVLNNTSPEENETEIEIKKINLNQTVTIGNVMELTLESSEWLDEIKPSNTSGAYSYYEDKEGEKYFVIKGKVKNIAGENLDIQYANESQILINDTYKATVDIEAEESDGSSFYGSIKPLQTLNIIVYASVSDEVFNICENIKLTLNMLSDSSKIGFFYDSSQPHETYEIEFKNSDV